MFVLTVFASTVFVLTALFCACGTINRSVSYSSPVTHSLKDEQIVLHGLPIRPDFSERRGSKASLRRRLGLHKDRPTVLLIGRLVLLDERLPCVRECASLHSWLLHSHGIDSHEVLSIRHRAW